MATERLSMRQIREILRQKWALGRTHREVAQSLSIGLGTVSGVERRARAAGLDWADVEGLTDEALGGPAVRAGPDAARARRPWPDCAYLHAERRKPGVTLELLHLEYLEQHPDGYRYTQFCEIYRRWLKRRGPVDAPGPPRRREVLRRLRRPEADAHRPRDRRGARGRALRRRAGRLELHLRRGDPHAAGAGLDRQPPAGLRLSSAGSPAPSCRDQLKSGVTVPCRYEPGLQRTYEEFAEHYGTVILPARPGKARDKAKVEVGRASRRALDPRPAPARDLLLAGRAERAHRASCSRTSTAA